MPLGLIEQRYTGPSETSREGTGSSFHGHAGTSRTVEPCGTITSELKLKHVIIQI